MFKMIFPDRLRSLYAESDVSSLLAPLEDETYKARISALEKRHIVSNFLSNNLSDGSYSGKLDRLTLTQAAARILSHLEHNEGLLEIVPHNDADEMTSFFINNLVSLNYATEITRELSSIQSHFEFFGNKKRRKNKRQPTLDLLQLQWAEIRQQERETDLMISYVSPELENYIGKGIKIDIEDLFEYKSQNCDLSNLRQILVQDSKLRTDIPLSYKLQKTRIFCLNEKERSKVSFVNHDILDHLITFKRLLNSNIFQNHSRLLWRLGFPLSGGEFYHRESELFAAINYAIRQFRLLESFSSERYVSELPFNTVAERLRDACEEDRENETYLRILEFLDELASQSDTRVYKLISHVLANVILEAEELQRKFGISLIFDDDLRVCGRLSHWDVDYLCFTIEAIQVLDHNMSGDIEHQEIEVQVSLELEKICHELIFEEFFISISELMNSDQTNSYQEGIPEMVYHRIVQSPNFATFPLFRFD